MPTSWNATLGVGHVTFQCRAQNADSITWRLNGSFLSQINPVIVSGIASGNVPTSSGFLYTLRIPTIAKYNNTVVECVAVTVGRQNSSLSDRVVLRMQGWFALLLSMLCHNCSASFPGPAQLQMTMGLEMIMRLMIVHICLYT